jgi:hypothetical protein
LRRPDWVARLRQTVADHKHVPFSYGRHDCSIFAAKCADAITGSNWLGTLDYTDLKTAAAFRRREGGLDAAVTKRLGEPLAGCGARRGDICLIDRKTLGVSLGTTIAVLSDKRLVFYPITRAQKHWRID